MNKKNFSKVYLKGKLSKTRFLFKNNDGIKIYKAILEIKRLSGTIDYIPIHIPENLLDSLPFYNQFVEITGFFHSYRNNTKLNLYVLASNIALLDNEEYENKILIEGYICSKRDLRTTPLTNKTIIDFIIATNYNNSSYYLPAVAWQEAAISLSETPIGSCISAYGRIQSRNYIKKHDDGTEENKIAYEISIYSFSVES